MADETLLDPRATALLDVVRTTLLDLQGDAPRPLRAERVTLDSSFDRDLALDSLARVELLLRIERRFGVALPEQTLQQAATPRDLLQALRAARPVPHAAALSAPATPPPDTAAVTQATTGAAAEESSAEDLPGPLAAATLQEVLAWHLRAHPDRTQIIFLAEADETPITYAMLHAGAAAIAAGLRHEGLLRGQAVALMLPTSPEYFHTYFGILLAGGIPVPVYPPARWSQIEEHVRRHAGILANAGAVILVTVPEAMTVGRLLLAQVPGLRRTVTPAELCSHGAAAASSAVQAGTMRPGMQPEIAPPGITQPEAPPAANASDIALIQYTSGSTGDPKGVVLTHANLLANIRAIGAALQINRRDVFVSWLPLYHDMGLISAWLASLYFGNPLVVMSPLAFLTHPERWLWAMHRHRGSLTAAPNFAYELCLKRITDGQIEGLDLSSLRFMANGAEPVSAATLERFAARFAAYGLNPRALAPVYGLAEATVGLCVPPPGRGPVIDCIDRERFTGHGQARPAAPDDPNPLRFVACGRPLPGHQVRVIDHTGQEAAERTEGRLEFKGPSATAGYYRNPRQTAALFHGAWLDSGDRAYIATGDVYLTGRIKDIIIRGGRNIYPHELEEAAGALAGVRKGCVAVFGSTDTRSGTERLVVLAETRLSEPGALAALREAIANTSVEVLGEPPDEVVLAAPHTVLKTSSGKLRRAACRTLYEEGLLRADGAGGRVMLAGTRAAWWQLLRLAARAVLPQLRRWRGQAAVILYAARVHAWFWLMAPPVWLLTALTPRPAWAWAVGHAAARVFLHLCGTSFSVSGVAHLPRDSVCIVVSNHASYLDGLILAAALPQHFCFIAKRELRTQFIARIYLERLGALFVERFAAQQSADDAARLAAAAAHGACLAFFAEGTFTREAGLRPFHLGAFAAAVQAQVPVVPVAIRGSRTLLRDNQWFARRSQLTVTISAPLMPPANPPDPFAAAIALRDATRAAILRDCGEPDAGRP